MAISEFEIKRIEKSAPGWTDSSIIVVMDLFEKENTTSIETYSYYSTWHRHIEKLSLL